MIHSMWVRDNITNKKLNNFEIDNNGKPILNKGERMGAPWISQSVGNMKRMVRNDNFNRGNFNEIGQFRTDNRFNYEMAEKNSFDNERYNFKARSRSQAEVHLRIGSFLRCTMESYRTDSPRRAHSYD